MAYVTLTASATPITGLAGNTTTGTSDGWTFSAGSGNVCLYIGNTDAAPHTATIVDQQTVEGATITDQVISIAANSFKLIADFASFWRDADGMVEVNLESGEEAHLEGQVFRVKQI